MPEYIEVLRAEVRVNVYDGPYCNQHKKYWNVYAVKDKEYENTEDSEFTINLKNHPPGTMVFVKEPLCPKCGEWYKNCMDRGRSSDCDFDWENWC